MTSMPTLWKDVLAETDLFAGLDAALLADLGFEERAVAAGEHLVRQGDRAESLFVVLAGRLEVVLDEHADLELDALGPGSIVGEIALMVGGTRSATVRATEPTRVLALSRERFDAARTRHPGIAEALAGPLQARLRRIAAARHLQEVLGALDAATLREVEREAQWRHLASGEVLFRKGDAADGAYLVVAVGRLRVVMEEAGEERVIDEVGPGQWVGEMALLTGQPRSATVYAVRDTELLWLSDAVFHRLIVKDPRALLETSRRLVARLQRQMGPERQVRAQLRSLAVVPTHGGVDVSVFAAQLASVLSGYGAVLHLSAAEVDRRLGQPGIANAAPTDPAHLRLAPWLVEQERQHRFVVYEAEPTASAFTERALRHADHVLLVADSARGPARGDVERALEPLLSGDHAPRRSLVLLQATEQRGHLGTIAWLQARKVDGHFHVRRGVRNDVARLVRILTGNAICLVFGGGGSRGYAHVGVLRVFEELGIPIDATGGTSIGAVIAAAAALGMSAEEILEVCAPILARFLDPTLPVVSLMAGQRALAGVSAVAKGLAIEDLPVPFFCVSTNLTRGGEMVHRTGSVAVATRASGSVPGIFPPVPWGDDLLVDGGLTNNVPVDTMASLFHGNIVAVDVIPEVDLTARGALPNHLSGWKVAWRYLNPFLDPIGMPNILSILIRSVTTASSSLHKGQRAAGRSALYLRPPVQRWNILDFDEARPIADQGYRATFEEIRGWWARERAVLMGEAGP